MQRRFSFKKSVYSILSHTKGKEEFTTYKERWFPLLIGKSHSLKNNKCS